MVHKTAQTHRDFKSARSLGAVLCTCYPLYPTAIHASHHTSASRNPQDQRCDMHNLATPMSMLFGAPQHGSGFHTASFPGSCVRALAYVLADMVPHSWISKRPTPHTSEIRRTIAQRFDPSALRVYACTRCLARCSIIANDIRCRMGPSQRTSPVPCAPQSSTHCSFLKASVGSSSAAMLNLTHSTKFDSRY